MTKDKLKKIEDILKSDIRWAIRTKGVGWNPQEGADCDGQGKWEKNCGGVCALGAHVMRHCKPKRDNEYSYFNDDNVDLAAKTLKVSYDWLESVFIGVAAAALGNTAYCLDPSAARMSTTLVDYANSYKKRYAAEKKRKRLAKAA